MLRFKKMATLSEPGLNANSLPISQRRRPRPSPVKLGAVALSTPAERFRLALELSDFCLALRRAARRKR